MNNRKREKIEIVHSILMTIRDNRNYCKPTHIIYKSNLSYKMLKQYLNELINKGFIIENKDKKGKKNYSLTMKGFKFLEDYDIIRSFMESYGLS